MIISRYVPFHFSVFVTIGILLATLNFPNALWISCQVMSLAGLLLLHRFYKFHAMGILGFYLTLVLFFVSGVALLIEFRTAKVSYQLLDSGKANPLFRYEIQKILSSNDKGTRLIAKAVPINNKYASFRTVIYVSSSGVKKDLAPGDYLFSRKRLTKIRQALNPGAFDFQKYWSNKDISRQLWLHKAEVVHCPSEKKAVLHTMDGVRRKLMHRLRSLDLREDEHGLSAALLLGNKQELPDDTKEAFRAAGLMHVLAISGLHIGLIIYLLHKVLWFLRVFRKGKEIQLILIFGMVVFYASVTDFPPSVVRATFIFGLYSVYGFLKRKASLGNSIFASFGLLLLINPSYVYDLGFRMSYGALMGIWLFFPLIKGHWSPQRKWVKSIWELIAISVSAQIGVLPLTLYHFHYFSAWFVLSGVLVIPLLGIILGLGITLLFFGPDLSEFFGLVTVYESLLQFVLTVANTIGKEDLLIAETVYFTKGHLCFILVLTGLFYRYLKKPIRLRMLQLFLGIFLFQGFGWYLSSSRLKGSDLWIFHDVNRSIAFRNGKELIWFGEQSIDEPELLKDFRSIMPPLIVHQYRWKNSIKFSKFHILHLNKLTPVPKRAATIDLLILSDSPRINLDRLIDQYDPTTVVAQGTNNWFDLQRWQRSCERSGITFHDTAKEGALKLDFSP